MIPYELMAAVCGDRSDDVPRLVVADWLDERGECERAEFIRVQCEIAKWNARPMPRDRSMTVDVFSELLFREALLLENHRYGWTDGLLGPEWKTCGLSGALVNFTKGAARTQPFHCIFQRGFIGEIICQWNDWSYHSAAILAAAPVQLVRLTTYPFQQEAVVPGRTRDELELAILHRQWPGIEFQLPHQPYTVRTNFAGVFAPRGPVEFAPLVPEGSGSGTRGG